MSNSRLQKNMTPVDFLVVQEDEERFKHTAFHHTEERVGSGIMLLVLVDVVLPPPPLRYFSTQ